MEIWQLQQKQSLPLEAKVTLSQQRIKEWYDYWDEQVYISFSGGKDSSVLLHLAREVYSSIPACFVNTGLEFPEVTDYIKTIDNVDWRKPKIPFKKVIETFGYPVVNKEQSEYLYDYREKQSEKLKHKRWYGDHKKRFKISEKWKFLVDAPFKISDYCCDVLKKRPFEKYEKETNRKPILGTMAADSNQRKQQYLRHGGCNAFNLTRPHSSPLSVWTDDDIWEYIHTRNLRYARIYDMGWQNTGCMFCLFGIHREEEPNRFQRMKETHPKQYNYCMNNLKIKEVLEFMNIPYE